jgi:phage terminase large subunit
MSKAAIRISQWRKDANLFVKDNFGIEPDAWQREALNALSSRDINKSRISLQACAGPGKSAFLAWAALWFVTCMGSKGEHPKGAAVAVTRDNLKDNLWPEISKWQGRSEFLKAAFEWTKERLSARDHPETWFLSARSWSKTSDEEEQGRTLSGLHSKYVLYLVDESGDIPVAVLKSAEQGLSNCEWGKIIQAGNPTSLTGMLYAASTTLRDKWHIICITGDPDDPMRSPRIDIEWARDQISKYGRQDPWVMSYILGKFPPSSINSLVSLD